MESQIKRKCDRKWKSGLCTSGVGLYSGMLKSPTSRVSLDCVLLWVNVSPLLITPPFLVGMIIGITLLRPLKEGVH